MVCFSGVYFFLLNFVVVTQKREVLTSLADVQKTAS